MSFKANPPMAAAERNAFTITVNGQAVGQTATLFVDGIKGSGRGGALLPHELTHVLQNRGAAAGRGGAKISLGKVAPVGGPAASQAGAYLQQQLTRGKRVRITAGMSGGIEFTSGGAAPAVADTSSDWTIVCEHIQRVT